MFEGKKETFKKLDTMPVKYVSLSKYYCDNNYEYLMNAEAWNRQSYSINFYTFELVSFFKN